MLKKDRLLALTAICMLSVGFKAHTQGIGSGLITRDISNIPGIRSVPAESQATKSTRLKCDVCVVGGGSGGIGAAVASARAGADVIMVEREPALGGTSTRGGVSVWARGPGCAISRQIYERISELGGVSVPDYNQTLTRRFGRTIPFNPKVFRKIVRNMLSETGHCRVLFNTCFVAASVNPETKRVVFIRTVDEKNGSVSKINARIFIDCTGDGVLCQAAGCETMLGADPKSRFNEPSAPAEPKQILNALEMIYKIRECPNPTPQPLPDGMQPRWQPGKVSCCADRLPDTSKRIINPCGLVPGWTLIEKGYEATLYEAKRQALAHWHIYQNQQPEYTFDSFSPMLAIRESYRIAGEYVLTERDIKTPFALSQHSDLIAYADHPMDTHGSGGGLRHAAVPYGIPYRCLIPSGGWKNLLIACRGASFSHIAASSCRLQRTIIQLGHAAGLAAAQCVSRQCGVRNVDVSVIQKKLGLPPPLLPWQLRLVKVVEGFSKPTSVCVNSKNGAVFVANTQKDRGFISRLSSEGEIQNLRWVESTPEQPLGSLIDICIQKGVLHGTDLSRITRYNIRTKQVLQPFDLPQGTSPSTIAPFRRHLFVSDTRQGKIYRVNGRESLEIATLAGASGLTVVEGCLYAVSKTEKDLYVIDPYNGWEPKPFGIDEYFTAPNKIEMLADGSFLVSDGEGQQLVCVSPDRQTVRRLAAIPCPADMALDWKRKRLFVPISTANRLNIYSLYLPNSK
ncbi:MAG: FAD-dependent oxidoreductase [Kiritimatiellia bacterium]